MWSSIIGLLLALLMETDGGQGQAPNDEPDESQGGQPDDAASPEDAHKSSELARARSEAAKYRTDLRTAQQELKELRAKETERTEAEKSELQRATDRVARLEADVTERDDTIKGLRLAQVVSQVANKLDIVDPDAAFALMDKAQVEYDGDQPTNIDDLLTKLVEAKPYLKRSGRKAPDPGATSPDGTKKRPLTRADIEKMTDDEVAARYDEVMAVMATEG